MISVDHSGGQSTTTALAGGLTGLTRPSKWVKLEGELMVGEPDGPKKDYDWGIYSMRWTVAMLR